jgi:hypothetical protein
MVLKVLGFKRRKGEDSHGFRSGARVSIGLRLATEPGTVLLYFARLRLSLMQGNFGN